MTDKPTTATGGTELTYELLMEAHKKMLEQPQAPMMTAKDMFFQVYFPDLNVEEHIIIASHLIEGIDRLDYFDWLHIDSNMTDTTVYAVKKDFFDIALNPKDYSNLPNMFKDVK